uniref:Uncharacterized protein n=1 Tax=Vespula pensylvanica TaxID=30213 RepID=A0A834K151_VESPE|nr:hypothetical protein H0235_016145 [Vespula pensylvanica]
MWEEESRVKTRSRRKAETRATAPDVVVRGREEQSVLVGLPTLGSEINSGTKLAARFRTCPGIITINLIVVREEEEEEEEEGEENDENARMDKTIGL